MSGIVGKNLGRGSGVVIATPVADESIDSDAYVDASIDNAHLADDAVDSDELAAGAVDLAHMSAESVNSDQYVDGSIDEAHIADNAVTLAKMAGGTDGNIISFDASGDPVAIATGSDGEVLTSAGAGAPPAFEAASGGAWTLIETYSLASNTSGVTKTGLDTTYGKLAVVFSDLKQDGDGNYLLCRMGDSGGLDTAVGDYDWFEVKTNTTASSFTAGVGAVDADPNSSFIRVGHGYGNATGEHFSAMLYVNKNSIANDSFCSIHGTWVGLTTAAQSFGGYTFGTWRKSATMDRIQFYPSAGAFVSGRISIYGISHT